MDTHRVVDDSEGARMGVDADVEDSMVELRTSEDVGVTSIELENVEDETASERDA